MNTLDNYKDQVYNIGSPTPSPCRSPLKGLPVSNEFENSYEFNDLSDTNKTKKATKSSSKIPKISNTSSTKRKLNSQESPHSPPKRAKMMSAEQFQEYIRQADARVELYKKETESYFDKTVQKFEQRVDNLAKESDLNIAKPISNFDGRLNGFAEKMEKVFEKTQLAQENIRKEFSAVTEQVSGLKTSLDNTNKKFEDKFAEIEGNLGRIAETVVSANPLNAEEIKEALGPVVKEEVIAVVKRESEKEIMPSVRATWNAIQAQKVLEHEHSLLVFGYESNKTPLEATGEILKKELKISEENLLKVSVKKAVRLGNNEGNKVPPLLITFGHPSERNLVMSHSKNLRNPRISLKKSVPKIYQEEFKRFENQAFKLRNMPGLEYQTQIIFDGHLMLLRRKLMDTLDMKYHYTTYWQYEPPMSSEAVQTTTLKTPQGTVATPPPNPDLLAKANTALFAAVKGMVDDITEDTFKREFLSFLKEEHRTRLVDFKKQKKNLAVAYFDTWDTANLIATTYTDKFMNHIITLTAFSDTNQNSNNE